MNRKSDYVCDNCGKAIEEDEIVQATRQVKVFYREEVKLWDVVETDNTIKILCKDCQGESNGYLIRKEPL